MPSPANFWPGLALTSGATCLELLKESDDPTHGGEGVNKEDRLDDATTCGTCMVPLSFLFFFSTHKKCKLLVRVNET